MSRRTLSALAGATLAAGLAGAVVEMLVVLPVQGALGASPARVFQGIAAGAMGRAAFTGGAGAVVLGVFFHTLISVVAAGVYVLAADRWDALRRRPWLGGLVLGTLCYVVMNFVVVPMSRIGPRPLPAPPLLLVSFAIHLLLFGVPIAWVATRVLDRSTRSWSTRR